ncbi:hypothetical protein [Ferrovibrio terrae]|uniref:hypothetical protein n=1 Tax=Ferrovibrio terrae TaxID=2594003 RepID=UPI0031377727
MQQRSPVLVLVGLGRMMLAAEKKFGLQDAVLLRARLVETLICFRGKTACWLKDAAYDEVASDQRFERQLQAFERRMQANLMIPYQQIDERHPATSALTLTMRMIDGTGLSRQQHAIHIVGPWYDGEDAEVDLIAYAFRGLRFATTIDAAVGYLPRLPRVRDDDAMAA